MLKFRWLKPFVFEVWSLLRSGPVEVITRNRRSVHVVVSVEPLLLLHRQPLQLRRLGVHGLQLVGCGHLGWKTSWQFPIRSTCETKGAWSGVVVETRITDRMWGFFLVLGAETWWGTYRTQGGAASRVRAAAGPGGSWGWFRVGKGSGPGEGRLPGGLLPAGGPRSLEDKRDIHHHLLWVRLLESRYTQNNNSVITDNNMQQAREILQTLLLSWLCAVIKTWLNNNLTCCII